MRLSCSTLIFLLTLTLFQNKIEKAGIREQVFFFAIEKEERAR